MRLSYYDFPICRRSGWIDKRMKVFSAGVKRVHPRRSTVSQMSKRGRYRPSAIRRMREVHNNRSRDYGELSKVPSKAEILRILQITKSKEGIKYLKNYAIEHKAMR